MDSRSEASVAGRWALPLLLVLAAAIRIIYLIAYHDLPQWDQLTVDNYYHHHWAESIAAGNVVGDTTFFRAPLYPYVLGLVYGLFGVSLWAARLFGLVVGLASIYCTYLIGRQAFSRQIGLVAAAIQCLNPILLYFEAELLLDMLFTLLLQASLLSLWRWKDRRNLNVLILAGLMTGAAAITRPTALVWAGLVVVWLLLQSGNMVARLRRLIMFVLGLSLVIGPIFLRNLYVAHDPVLIASQGGINFYIGNNESADGISSTLPEPMGNNWQIKQITREAEREAGRPLKPGEVSSYWSSRAMRWIIDNPGSFVRMYLKKLYYGIGDREFSNNRDLRRFFITMPLLRYNPISFSFVLAFALLGAMAGWRHGGSRVRLLIGLVLTYLLTIALFFFSSRFRLPVLPLLMVLASVGAVTVLDLFATNVRRGAVAMSVVVVIWAVSYYPLVRPPGGAATQDLISQGIHFYSQGNYQNALGYFYTARMFDPSTPEVSLNIGACYLRLGIEDSALYYLEEERRRNPARPKTYSNLASLHLINGRYSEAVAHSEQAISLADWDVTASMILLRALAGLDSLTNDGLRTYIEEAAARTDNDLYLLNDAALLLLRRGDTTEAESLLQRALHSRAPPIETDDGAFSRDFPNHFRKRLHETARTRYLLGLLAGLSGRYHLSISHNHQAIAADSNLVEAYVNLAGGYRFVGQLESADSVMNEAMRRFPNHQLIQNLRRENEP